MLVANNWNSESKVKIHPVVPKYDVFGHFRTIWGTFTRLLFNMKTAMHKRLPTERKFPNNVICLESKAIYTFKVIL